MFLVQKHLTAIPTVEIISAVDIHYKKKLVYSKVDVTNTRADCFLDSAFRVKLPDSKESLGKFDGEDDMNFSDLKEFMTLSWIIIDPALKRAANISSLWPVSVRRHWIGGDIEVKYATMVRSDCRGGMTKLVECRIVTMLGWKGERELELRGVKLEVQDMDGKSLSGKDSLVILQQAIQSGRRKKGKKGEEEERYRKFVNMKRVRRKEKERRGRRLKMVLAMFRSPATIFLVLVFLVSWAGHLLCLSS